MQAGNSHLLHDICLCFRRLRDWAHQKAHIGLPMPAGIRHAAARAAIQVAAPVLMQPTVPASLLLGVHLQASHRLPFPLLSWGILLSSPAFLPRPQSRAVALVTVKPATCPERLPCLSLSWPLEAARGENRASTNALEGFENRKRTISTWQKKVTNATPEIFNTLRVICPPITRSRFSATCTEYCKHPETFPTLSCDLATRLFTCLRAGPGVPGHRISCPDIDTAIKSR